MRIGMSYSDANPSNEETLKADIGEGGSATLTPRDGKHGIAALPDNHTDEIARRRINEFFLKRRAAMPSTTGMMASYSLRFQILAISAILKF